MNAKWVYKTIPESGNRRGWFIEISELGMSGWEVCGVASGLVILKKPATDTDEQAVRVMLSAMNTKSLESGEGNA